MNSPSTVPKPWTPLSVRGSGVHCWGREYRADGPLPQQIVSQGEPLLAGLITLKLTGEPPLRWKTGVRERHPRTVSWRSTAKTHQGMSLTANTTVEFDGFYEVEVEFGKGSFPVTTLEIPLSARHARYLHFVNETHYQEQNTLELARRDGEIWKDRFACLTWVGDEDTGLTWCAESPALAVADHPRRMMTLHRRGSAVTLRITLFDHPVTLAQPLRWRFALMATPIRPLPPKWRDWRLSPGKSANIHILWWNSWAASHADPVPKDPAALKKHAQEVRDWGHHLLPYIAFQAMSERSPAYREKWRREPISKLEDEGTPYWIVCPNTEWRTYLPEQLTRLCREYGVNGLYLDFTFPYACEASHHPCGQKSAAGGGRQGEFQIFELRRMAQALYEGVKAVDPDARILMHTSGALMYPYIGFADLMLNGEQLRQPLAKAAGHYMDVLPLETLRAEYRGRQAGLAPFVIPELATPEGMPDPKLTTIPGPTEEMLALLLLHDIGVWPIYCHLETVEAVRQAQQQFGTAGTRFLPYWEQGGKSGGAGPLALTHPALLASAWMKPSELLVVVVNRDRNAALTTELRLRPGMGRVTEASDALSGQPVPESGGKRMVSVPPRNFRLLRLRTKP